MRTVIYRQLRESELAEASRQLTASYRAAYRGLMDEAYLTSLQEDHWVEILQASMERGDICLVAADGEDIVGAAVCGRSEGRRGSGAVSWRCCPPMPGRSDSMKHTGLRRSVPLWWKRTG